MLPTYLADFDQHVSDQQRVTSQDIEKLVEKLWQSHDSFRGFCRAFSQLHGHLIVQGDGEIDFRSFAVMDYFLVMALRAEVLLADILMCYSNNEKSMTLKDIIGEFGANLPPNTPWAKGINHTISHWKELTNLRDKPDDPFKRIQEKMIGVGGKDPDVEFAIQLLTFGMTRNYFAHHTYFDNQFLERNGKIGRAGLVSILVAVIYLTYYYKKENWG